jgi:hypothetical protein
MSTYGIVSLGGVWERLDTTYYGKNVIGSYHNEFFNDIYNFEKFYYMDYTVETFLSCLDHVPTLGFNFSVSCNISSSTFSHSLAR